MGVLNVTPDSFSDGGLFASHRDALRRAERMLEEGADLIDIGAESTRPGAEAVSAEEQLRRIGSLVSDVTKLGGVCSIDTTLVAVAKSALDAGARWINSVSLEPAAVLGELGARYDATLVLMHSRGSMTDMAGFSNYAEDAYGDVVRDVAREWMVHAERALGSGLARERLVLDPGLGFQKNARQSLALCARLAELCALGFDVMVGPSRKSFLARVTRDAEHLGSEGHSEAPLASPEDRLGATIATVIACVARGAKIVRVHDVFVARQALRMASAIAASTPLSPPPMRPTRETRARQS